MSGTYTQALSDLMWEQSYVDAPVDDDYQSVLAVLKSDSFHSFPSRLLAFVNQLWNADYDAQTAAKEVLKSARHYEVPINRNTVLNWFTGKSVPNMGRSSRERMYILAFALGLNPKQTKLLFEKVLLDRGYNPRNIMEFVYRYCLSEKIPFQEATKLLSKAKAIISRADSFSHTIETQFIEATSDSKINDEEELLAVIERYGHNFVISDIRAKAEVANLLEKTRGNLAVTEYKMRHQFENEDHVLRGKDINSLDFLLYVINDQESINKNTNDVPSLPDLFPEEIANDFPDKSTFSLSSPSSYILRKEIIFLFFYIIRNFFKLLHLMIFYIVIN